METMPRNDLQYLPSPYRELFLPEYFIQARFKLWPRHIRGESATLMVKKDMIISEIMLLLRQKLQLRSDEEVRVFTRCLPLEEEDVFQERNGGYDCVFASSKLSANTVNATQIGKSAQGVSRTTQSNKDVSIVLRVKKNYLLARNKPALKYIYINRKNK